MAQAKSKGGNVVVEDCFIKVTTVKLACTCAMSLMGGKRLQTPFGKTCSLRDSTNYTEGCAMAYQLHLGCKSSLSMSKSRTFTWAQEVAQMKG